MKNPGFQFSLVCFACAILFAFSAGLRAEPPPSAPDVQSSKVPPGTRTKPQIIYHVRPASNYAATLHSQEKTRNNELPIDNDMPTSLQLSRSNANAEARAQQEAAVRERSPKRPKVQGNQVRRPPVSVKSKGHGNKGHKH
jgi:hypothetical protein